MSVPANRRERSRRPWTPMRAALFADAGRAIAMAAGGAMAFAPVEYALTLWAYAGPVSIASKLRLVALTATLALWLWMILAIVTVAVVVAARVLRRAIDTNAAHGGGLFAAAPVDDRGIRPGVPRVWAAVATAGVAGLVLQRAAAWAIEHFKEPQLTGALIAIVGLAVIALAPLLVRAGTLAATVAATAVAAMLGRTGVLNPLGRWRAAGVALAALAAGALAAIWFALPQSRSVLPVRLAISAIASAFGMGLGALYHLRGPRRSSRRARRRGAFGLAAGALVLTTTTMLWWGADLETKYVAVTASPALDSLIDVVRYANDLDGDGFGSLLGENDCAPFDASIHPGAIDIPDDGIDQNCDGHDFTMRSLAPPAGDKRPVPPEFRKDWNVLFITVDTLRYDHTTFGGYADAAKHRDTTPRLADWVKHAVSFTNTEAPSAGTMASIPAIITSKYFHSGIALDVTGVPPGMPPRLKPENTLLTEIMKRKGYYTGVIASHEYWNDWGMDQGVDDYDNSIGKTPDPFRVAADKSTDHALAWISRQQGKKWFLWVHYIDPHGRYVAHPDVVDYGSSEPDLYDAEIKWTDQEIGRLFDELKRLPSYDHTIIVLTSDHGDSMGEHTVPLGTHGTALYFELQHVPMIFYIPNNTPKLIGGAVSNLDIVPTLAELCGIDVHDLQFEGRSLVPQLFYPNTADHDRIVFAETNAPAPQRAAISEKYKLIFYLKNNVYELFDEQADPGEKVNLAGKNVGAMTLMKTALDAWLERVVYSRDAKFNQATERMADVLISDATPPPTVATTGQTIDHGKVEIAGVGAEPGKPIVAGAKLDVFAFFNVKDHTTTAYRFQLVAWPVDLATWHPNDPLPAAPVRSALRMTADGFFPPDRWRVNDRIRDRFPMQLPADWHSTGVAFGLLVADPIGVKQQATGDHPDNDATIAVLGALPMAGVLAPPPQAPGIVPVPMVPAPLPAGGKPRPSTGSSAAVRP